MREKPHILILIHWFLPGYKAGGPIQSASNLIQALGDDYTFSVITKNVDHGSNEPFQEVAHDQWTVYKNIKVYYFSKAQFSYSKLKNLIIGEKADFIFLNGMFSPGYTILPLWMRARNVFTTKTVIAPRGMLKRNAVKTRFFKKKVFLTLVRLTGVHKKVTWQVTNEEEKSDVERFFGKNLDIKVAANIPKQDQLEWASTPKKKGEARFAFSSRISPIKNIEFFMERLKATDGKVVFDVYGPEEDKEYLNSCKKMAAELPENIKVNFKGGIPAPDLPKVLKNYHFSVLTSKSENFGHAIFEGMLAGKPVITSERTPWRNLTEVKTGWVYPLEEPELFEEAIKHCVDMDQEEYDLWSRSAWEYAKNFKESPDLMRKIRAVFS